MYNSFHGRTIGSLSATSQPKYWKGFGFNGKMLQGFKSVNYNDEEELKKVFKKMDKTPWYLKLLGRKRRVAAIMLEPLQGEGGIKPGTKSYLELARTLCDKSETSLLIMDEVQVGMGRSGFLWGHERVGVTPDVFTSAKGLGGGIPIGALLTNGVASTVFGPGDHASTYGGNPLACSAGLAIAKAFTDENILENVNSRSEQLVSGLNKIQEKYPNIIKEVRGWGLLIGVELSSDIPLLASNVVKKAMENGLLLVPAGLKVVRFVPRLNVEEGEIASALEMFEEVIKGVA